MEKQIETVYVPTKESRGSFTLDDLNKTMVINTKAYLYTPEEHAAVQGYREALEKISDECTRTDISITHIVGVVSNALSKAEDKGEGFETSYGEVLSTIRTPIEQPTNSLDELEKDILSNYDMDDALLVSYIIAKIQSLKNITP